MMKTDINGCSTTANGQEQYEWYQSPRGRRIQYDYRTPQGKLFSCVAKSLEQARQKRDNWLIKIAENQAREVWQVEAECKYQHVSAD